MKAFALVDKRGKLLSGINTYPDEALVIFRNKRLAKDETFDTEEEFVQEIEITIKGGKK